MAITHRATSTAGASTGTTLACTRPTGITADDIIFLDFYIETTGLTPAFTNGTWTLIHQTIQTGSATDFEHFRYWSRYAGEGTTFTISWGGTSTWRSAGMLAKIGISTAADPKDGTPTEQIGGASSVSAVAPGITTATNNSLVVNHMAHFRGDFTVTPPTGTTPTFTERVEFDAVYQADGILATAGATGDKTSTISSADWSTAGLDGWLEAASAVTVKALAALGVGG